MEADELRADEGLAVDRAGALHADEAVGAGVLDGALGAGIDGEFLGGEELFAVDLAVDDPAVDVALAAGVGDGDGLEVVVVLEIWIHVLFPVELVDDEVDVLVLGLGHVFHEEGPRHFAALDEVLIHAEDVGAPLGLVGAEGAGGVENARVDEPAGADLEAVGFGEIEDAVVALVPVADALFDLLLGGAGLEAHEGVGEVVADGVVLGREVVGLGFAFLADELRLGGALVHVVRDRPHVIEEFRVDGPFAVFFPDGFADDGRAAIFDGLGEGEALVADDGVAEALVVGAALVGGDGGGGEPAFVDAAAVQAVGVGVIGVEFDAEAGLEEGARHPGGGEAEETAGGGELGLNEALRGFFDDLEIEDGGNGHGREGKGKGEGKGKEK